jgi:hypothetical protein
VSLTASGVPRALACPSSLVLPRHRFASPNANAGVERHAEMEAAIDVGDAARVLPEAVLALIEGMETTTEAAFAYDCATDTARPLGHGRTCYTGENAGKLAPYELPGTIDLLAHRDGRYVVVDKKGYERVGAASLNAQTLTYALMVARATEADEVTVVIFYEIGAPDIAVIDAITLQAHADQLRDLQLRVVQASARVRDHLAIGRHCRYCEAYFHCPAQHQANALAIIEPEAPLRFEAMLPLERDEDAARAFELYERVKLFQSRLHDVLAARAMQRPIPLADGRVYGPREKEGSKRLDGDIAWRVLRDLHGQTVADAATKRTATQKGIEDALRQLAGPLAPRKRKVLEAIDAAGGVKQSTSTVIDAHEPKELKAG